MWLLLCLAQAKPPEPPTLPVKLGLPEGYIEILATRDRPEREYVRRFTVAPEGEIRLTATLLPGPVAEGMTPPYTFLRPAQLPPDAEETTNPRAWLGLQIYAAEYAYAGPEGRRFAAAAALPLRDRALLLRLSGPETRAPDVRADLASLLEGTRGLPGWLTPLEKKLRKQSDMALIAGGVLLALYVACWAGVFRNQPWMAHGLRTAWLGLAGGALLIPAILGVNLIWAMPAMFVLSLAIRRIKLALEA